MKNTELADWERCYKPSPFLCTIQAHLCDDIHFNGSNVTMKIEQRCDAVGIAVVVNEWHWTTTGRSRYIHIPIHIVFP